MATKVKLRASVGRQKVTGLTPANQSAYIRAIRQQFNDIVRNYEQFVNALERQSPQLLLDALAPTFDLSQKYVPRDTNKLADSGFLEVDKSSKQPRVVIGYAKGGEPHYAVFVHEIMDTYHSPPTRAKFLLSALEEDAGNIQRRIVNGYKTMVGA